MSNFEVGDRVFIGESAQHDEYTKQAVGRWGKVVGDPTEGGRFIVAEGDPFLPEGWVFVEFDGESIEHSQPYYYYYYYHYYFPPTSLHHAEPDAVKHPKHYSAGMPEGVQVIDIIRAQGANFEHGSVIKYILRWKFKNGLEDLKKAQVYLGWLIEQEEQKNG